MGIVMSAKTIPLESRERVIAVVPTIRFGPGWANNPVSVYIVDTRNGSLRQEYIQPEEQTAEMHTIFAIGVAVCNALVDAVPTTKI